MIWNILACVGIAAITGICALIIWGAYELRKLAQGNGWTLDL